MGCAEKDMAAEPVILAERAGLGDVSLCACGTVHLSIASVTLRMAPEAFAQVLRMCEQAGVRLLMEMAMRETGGREVVTH